MAPSELNALLARLHDALAGRPALDDEGHRLLGLVLADIGRLPVEPPAGAAHVPALERLAVRFESDHPAVAAAARALVDALAKAGI